LAAFVLAAGAINPLELEPVYAQKMKQPRLGESMDFIEKLESAHAQTWWLPESVEIHEGPDHCFYDYGGRFNIVRFTPSADDLESRLNQILQVVGDDPAQFTFLPHRHDEKVLRALKAAGFVSGQRHEARVIHVDNYERTPSEEIKVNIAESFEDIKRVYWVRNQAFGDTTMESDETLRVFLKASSGSKARVRQFLAVDAHSGENLSQAGMSLFPDLKFALFFAGATLPDARERGAYTALVAARVAYAHSVGIEHVGLFARADTSAPIVTRHGFEHCGEMQYWVLNRA
jgi:N-acetylglutamate synthase-like GNAT family acetyltransferase